MSSNRMDAVRQNADASFWFDVVQVVAFLFYIYLVFYEIYKEIEEAPYSEYGGSPPITVELNVHLHPDEPTVDFNVTLGAGRGGSYDEDENIALKQISQKPSKPADISKLKSGDGDYGLKQITPEPELEGTCKRPKITHLKLPVEDEKSVVKQINWEPKDDTYKPTEISPLSSRVEDEKSALKQFREEPKHETCQPTKISPLNSLVEDEKSAFKQIRGEPKYETREPIENFNSIDSTRSERTQNRQQRMKKRPRLYKDWKQNVRSKGYKRGSVRGQLDPKKGKLIGTFKLTSNITDQGEEFHIVRNADTLFGEDKELTAKKAQNGEPRKNEEKGVQEIIPNIKNEVDMYKKLEDDIYNLFSFGSNITDIIVLKFNPIDFKNITTCPIINSAMKGKMLPNLPGEICDFEQCISNLSDSMQVFSTSRNINDQTNFIGSKANVSDLQEHLDKYLYYISHIIEKKKRESSQNNTEYKSYVQQELNKFMPMISSTMNNPSYMNGNLMDSIMKKNTKKKNNSKVEQKGHT